MISNLLKCGLTIVSPGGNQRLSVLIYHRVLPRPDILLPGLIDARAFERQIATLARCFNMMSLPNAILALSTGTLPPRAAAITFDDGYADNHEVALPILTKYGVHGTFFIASGYLEGGFMWNDGIIEAIRGCKQESIDAGELELGTLPLVTNEHRRSAIVSLVTRLKYLSPAFRDHWAQGLLERTDVRMPKHLMMNYEQVRSMFRAGMQIGGHTETHPILTKVSIEEARREIAQGKARLESIIDGPVQLFAYPNGRPGVDFGPQHVRLVKELGFDAALSTRWGAAQTGDDLFQLPRYTSWGRTEFRFQGRMAMNIVRSRLDLPSPPYWELSN